MSEATGSETLHQLTETGFHRRLATLLHHPGAGPLPLGDDCAAIGPAEGEYLLATTDAVVEGTHFPVDTPPRFIGHLASAVNLSDLAAKGAIPAGLLCSLILPPETPAAWAEAVVLGMEEVAERHGTHVIGGDTKSGTQRVVTGVGLGWGYRGQLMPRTGARPGDLIATTGSVGRGGASFLAYEHGIGDRKRALANLLSVEPRLTEGAALRDLAHAAIDSSDGFARSVRLLGEASRVGAVVEGDRLPYHPEVKPVARKLSLPDSEVALMGGDYELILAIPVGKRSEAAARARKGGFPLTFVGHFTTMREFRLEGKGGTEELPDIGWDAFAHHP